MSAVGQSLSSSYFLDIIFCKTFERRLAFFPQSKLGVCSAEENIEKEIETMKGG